MRKLLLLSMILGLTACSTDVGSTEASLDWEYERMPEGELTLPVGSPLIKEGDVFIDDFVELDKDLIIRGCTLEVTGVLSLANNHVITFDPPTQCAPEIVVHSTGKLYLGSLPFPADSPFRIGAAQPGAWSLYGPGR